MPREPEPDTGPDTPGNPAPTARAAPTEIRDAPHDIKSQARALGQPPRYRAKTESRAKSLMETWHDETVQGHILAAWERLTSLTGNHDLAQEAGFELQPDLLAYPRTPDTSPENTTLREAMQTILKPADAINDCPEDADRQAHNQTQRNRILHHWEVLQPLVERRLQQNRA